MQQICIQLPRVVAFIFTLDPTTTTTTTTALLLLLPLSVLRKCWLSIVILLLVEVSAAVRMSLTSHSILAWTFRGCLHVAVYSLLFVCGMLRTECSRRQFNLSFIPCCTPITIMLLSSLSFKFSKPEYVYIEILKLTDCFCCASTISRINYYYHCCLSVNHSGYYLLFTTWLL